MNARQIMLVAGDPSGDAHAAQLVLALAQRLKAAEPKMAQAPPPGAESSAARFFGAGGPRMAAAEVELAFDLTTDTVIGPAGVIAKLPRLRRRFSALMKLALERRPDLIVLVDYGGFNLRFAHALRTQIRSQKNGDLNWRPKIAQFISPQVWASRPWRAKRIAADYDLLISLFPFEKEWYAGRAPGLPVVFVGHPLAGSCPEGAEPTGEMFARQGRPPLVLLLPGSRAAEVRRHAPILIEAARLIAAKAAARFLLVVPTEELAALARGFLGTGQSGVEVRVDGLRRALLSATVALTKSGTITVECACFRVPAVVMYRADWLTYWLGRWLVNVKYLAMPNLLAGEEVYPEFVQGRASPANLAGAVLDLLGSQAKRDEVRRKLEKTVDSLKCQPDEIGSIEPARAPAELAARALTKLMGWG